MKKHPHRFKKDAQPKTVAKSHFDIKKLTFAAGMAMVYMEVICGTPIDTLRISNPHLLPVTISHRP